MLASTWMHWKGIIDTFKEHRFWPLSRNAVTDLVTMDNNQDCTKLHRSSKMIYSSYIGEGELNVERLL
jgi:hypothetical protein